MNIYEQALRKWGINSQLDMTIEECAELIQAINKFRRSELEDKATREHLIEECVDVELMINQMREYFNDEANTRDDIKMQKIERLHKLLEVRER